MRRYPTFDPPEYLDWKPDPELVRAYRIALQDDPERWNMIQALEASALLDLYRQLLRTRLHDITLKRWVRQGVLSKAWLGTGEEAVTVGAVRALTRGTDVVCPMIRNAGACLLMGMTPLELFYGYLANERSPNGGRDLHLGRPELGVFQPVSQMGINVGVMAGVALAFRNRKEPRVALTWVGDGATRTGIAHEGANLAASQDLPLVLVVQDNHVALGTRAEEHTRGSLLDWVRSYGIPCREVDGNNVLDVWAATRLAVNASRAGAGTTAILATTFRLGGHATHDEREARSLFPPELFQAWGRRDPVGLYEAYLREEGIAEATLEEVESDVVGELEEAEKTALAARDQAPAAATALFQGVSRGGVLDPIRHRLMARSENRKA